MQNKDQEYARYWDTIRNILQNNISYKGVQIARAGSRVQGGWTDKSDLDIRFSLKGDPSKQSVYPELVRLLKQNIPKANVEIGNSYNVINMSVDGLEFDIVLLTTQDFNEQVRNSKLKRIT